MDNGSPDHQPTVDNQRQDSEGEQPDTIEAEVMEGAEELDDIGILSGFFRHTGASNGSQVSTEGA